MMAGLRRDDHEALVIRWGRAKMMDGSGRYRIEAYHDLSSHSCTPQKGQVGTLERSKSALGSAKCNKAAMIGM